MEISDLQKNLRELVEALPADEGADYLNKLVSELKSFLQYIEQVDKNAAEEILKSLESTTDNALFQEVGRLLRRFHDQIVLIREGIPEDLGKIATQEVVEMSERLQMIVTMTDKAATKTLDLTEKLMDTIGGQNETLEQVAASLQNTLDKASLSETLTESLKSSMNQVKQLIDINNENQDKLTEILIAQDYQDLTGQVIFKVINLLKSLELDLAKLIDRFGQVMVADTEDPGQKLKGPLEEENAEKSDQEDVDALLNKFGF